MCRRHFFRHMLFGQGFLWSDLVAYTVGIAVIFILTTRIEESDARNNPLMNEGAGGVDVPQALFYCQKTGEKKGNLE